MTDASIPDDATNVLVLASSGTDALATCAAAAGDGARVLAVSYTRPVDELVAELRDHVPSPSAEVAVVRTQHGAGSDAPDGVTVHVEGPDNLTGIGVRTNEFLTRWRDEDAPVVVYFDSITALLQHADLKLAYRFLHTFTERVHGADATAYYHLQPEAHDESTVATLRQLFDTVVTRRDDGTYDVGRR